MTVKILWILFVLLAALTELSAVIIYICDFVKKNKSNLEPVSDKMWHRVLFFSTIYACCCPITWNSVQLQIKKGGIYLKILYFGLADELAENILQALLKEGNSVSAVFEKKKKLKGIKCKVYEYDVRQFDSQIGSIMKFVKPDAIVFCGKIMNNQLGDEANDYDQMHHILVEAEKNKVRKFIYLSSIEVNHVNDEHIQQSDWCLYHAQQEYMLSLTAQRAGMQTTILRTAPLFSGLEESKMKAADQVLVPNQIVQPIHVKDVAIAVSRFVEEERGDLRINLCGSTAITLQNELGNLVCRNCESIYSNEEAKKLISWTDFHSFVYTENVFLPSEKKEDSKYKNTLKSLKKKSFIRAFLENLVIFVLFMIPEIFLINHSLFQTVNWMLIYIVIISLYLGIVQSAFAVLLASVLYLYLHDVNIFEITSVFSYLEYLIMIAEYIFFGIAVGYSNNMIRNRLLDKKMDYDMLKEDHEELKSVFEQNTRIKDEYEQRLINSQNTIPKLNSIMNKLNVLKPGKIFIEVNYVISDLLRTETVAVYRTDKNSKYLRLLSSLNEKSAFGGKTWNLEPFPEIYERIQEGEIAIGKAWTEEPAMTIPIRSGGELISVIAIRELSLETRSLYYLNMMRTLSELISDAMTRAVEYERLMETRRYMEGTNVLNQEEFKNQVEIHREMKNSNIASFTVLRIPKRDWREIHFAVDKALRTVDFIGVNDSNELSVLLVNTSNEECRPVVERLGNLGMEAMIEE